MSVLASSARRPLPRGWWSPRTTVEVCDSVGRGLFRLDLYGCAPDDVGGREGPLARAMRRLGLRPEDYRYVTVTSGRWRDRGRRD